MNCKYKSEVWENLWCNRACMYCTGEQERTCDVKEPNTQTNADRIRGMSDELLATQFVQVFREGVKFLTDVDMPDEMLDKFRDSFLKKLKEPAEE